MKKKVARPRKKRGQPEVTAYKVSVAIRAYQRLGNAFSDEAAGHHSELCSVLAIELVRETGCGVFAAAAAQLAETVVYRLRQEGFEVDKEGQRHEVVAPTADGENFELQVYEGSKRIL